MNIPSPDHPNCAKCTLYQGCQHPFIPMEMEEDRADVLLVGESPGEQEDSQGSVFVGPTGDLLRRITGPVEEDGIKIAYTNAVRCHPPQNDTKISHVKHCAPFLLEDIKRSGATSIVLMGNHALKAITGQTGITEWRGNPLQKNGLTFVPTFHPAYVLRNQGDEHIQGAFVDDILRAVELVDSSAYAGADKDFTYRTITTYKEWQDAFRMIKDRGRTAFDLETVSLRPFAMHNAMVMASFALREEQIAWALPLFHRENPLSEYDLMEVLQDLYDFADSQDVLKIGHNIKFDVVTFYAQTGIHVRGVAGDTMLASQLLDSRPGFHGLKQLSGKHLGMFEYDWELETYIAEHKEADPKQGGHYGNIPLSILGKYAAKDAAATILLEPILLKEMDGIQRTLYRQMMIPASTLYTHIESNGCKPDLEIVKQYTKVYQAGRKQALEEMREHPAVQQLEADQEKPYNPRSGPQTAKVLYGYMKRPVHILTNTGKPSVNKNARALIDDPWIDLYNLYSLYSVSLSNYLLKIPRFVERDGRIRSNYGIVGARTSRTSSSKPNLQNITSPELAPGTLLESHPIRNFIQNTWEGGCLLSVDFAQIELRVMASLAHCTSMIEMFKAGKDLHRFVASKIYHVPEEEITDFQRQRAKTTNFTMTYLGGPQTMADGGMPLEEAQHLYKEWNTQFSEIPIFCAEQADLTRERGYSLSPFGKRRYLPGIYSDTRKIVEEAKRAAANHPVQSAASDMLVLAGSIVLTLMKAHGYRSMIINTVHDNLDLDIYPGELEEVHELVIDVMTGLPQYAREYAPDIPFEWLIVPIGADAKAGTHYGDLKHYPEEM